MSIFLSAGRSSMVMFCSPRRAASATLVVVISTENNAPMILPLEMRRLLSVSLSYRGTLFITGTGKDNVVQLYHTADQVSVVSDGSTSQFPYDQCRRLKASLVGGNDTFIVHGSIRRPMTVSGGGGDDDLRVGSGNDVIEGSDGDDHIVGGLGNDTLDGGPGNDRIEAADDPVIDPLYNTGPPFSADTINTLDGNLYSDVLIYGYFDKLHTDAVDQLTFNDGAMVLLIQG